MRDKREENTPFLPFFRATATAVAVCICVCVLSAAQSLAAVFCVRVGLSR